MSVAIRLEGIRCGSREANRFAIGVPVLGQSCDEELLVLVHDLSITGMRIETRRISFSVGDWLRVSLPMLEPQLVQVVWADRLDAGVTFAKPLSPAILPIVIRALLPASDDT